MFRSCKCVWKWGIPNPLVHSVWYMCIYVQIFADMFHLKGHFGVYPISGTPISIFLVICYSPPSKSQTCWAMVQWRTRCVHAASRTLWAGSVRCVPTTHLRHARDQPLKKTVGRAKAAKDEGWITLEHQRTCKDLDSSPHRFTCMGFLLISEGCIPGPHDFAFVAGFASQSGCLGP